MTTVSPTMGDLYEKLRAFLLTIVTPPGGRFVGTGTIDDGAGGAGTVLTISAVTAGALAVGNVIEGGSIAPGTKVTAQVSGTPGGVGVYTVNVAQDYNPGGAVLGPYEAEVIQGLGNRATLPVGPFIAMTAILTKRLATNQDSYVDPVSSIGTRAVQQSMQVDVQLDFYGPKAGDWAVMATTLLRDDYGCDALAPVAAPLHADDAMQAPFVSGEEQYVSRWIVTASLAYNPVTTIPQQFADAAVVDLINVDERYKP